MSCLPHSRRRLLQATGVGVAAGVADVRNAEASVDQRRKGVAASQEAGADRANGTETVRISTDNQKDET